MKKNEKSAKSAKIDSRKNINSGLKSLKSAAQTLNACLKAVNYALVEGNDSEALRCTQLSGTDLQTVLGVMGIDFAGGLTVKTVRSFWTTNVLQTGYKKDPATGEQVLDEQGQPIPVYGLAMYRNWAVRDQAGKRVYVANKVTGELEPLSIWRLQLVDNNAWTVASFVKGVEQNYLPSREQKKSERTAKEAQEYSQYFVKIEGSFVEISRDEVVF